MTHTDVTQIVLYLLVVLLLVKPLGWYIARVYQDKPCGLNRVGKRLELYIYRLAGIQPEYEMGWKNYLFSVIIFHLFGMLLLYAILRLQAYLPWNPQHFSAVAPDLAFNISASFVTNTNWQAYGGEYTLSYFAQMLGLTVQNFLSAATGLALLIAFIRGLVRREASSLGNFWVDLVRGVLYIFLPLAIILSLLLVSQGVIQNLKPYQTVELIQPFQQQGMQVTEQTLPMGPAASQVAIKQLGTNGGGFFNASSAHPFENPTPLSNFLEMLAILLIPAALCYSFGVLVNDRRQGWAILFAMSIVFVPLVCADVIAEHVGNPAFSHFNVASIDNMEGKETRFGIVNSAIWTVATTATSNGAVNSTVDSYTPLGGLIPLWLMHLGEIIFGGVGTGLYGMLCVLIITVFVAGLMVGRSPEYLGKKIEPYEMKMASFIVLLMPMVVLVLTAISVAFLHGKTAAAAHGFSEILYAFTSMGNNNGSAFGGLEMNTRFYNIAGGLEMLAMRFWVAAAVIALAGSLARKKILPQSVGTLSTLTPLFLILLLSVIFVFGALTFFPALALGPIAEHLIHWGYYAH